MKFNQLTEKARIEKIKNNFATIVQKLFIYPDKLAEILKVEPYVEIAPKLIDTSSMTSELAKVKAEAKNLRAKVETEELNAKNKKAYEENKATHDAILKYISSIKKDEDCDCQTCFDPSVLNNLIPAELNYLIELAKKQSEAGNY